MLATEYAGPAPLAPVTGTFLVDSECGRGRGRVIGIRREAAHPDFLPWQRMHPLHGAATGIRADAGKICSR
jgi:hypothetical protein